MSDPLHPTRGDWVMFDPIHDPPPKGVHLLLATVGGVLVIGPWTDDCVAWSYKPKIPDSVKTRLRQQKQERESVCKPTKGSDA